MKKRLLFIPLHYDTTPRPHEDWFNALNIEFDCWHYGSHKKCTEYNFDYIFFQSGAIEAGHLYSLKSLTGNKAKLIQWTGDARAELMENVTQYKGIVDLTLLAVGIGQKKMYEDALGSPIDYLQQGVFESFFKQPKELQSGKIVFIGNNYDQFNGARERNELCFLLSRVFPNDFETIGNGYDYRYNNIRSVPYEESATIYNDAYISISHACFNDIEGYYSNRTLDIMASGGCCLMRYTPRAEQFFTENLNVVFYHSNQDCIDKIKMIINGSKLSDIRNRVARGGNSRVKLQHAFSHRAREIKQLIEKHGL